MAHDDGDKNLYVPTRNGVINGTHGSTYVAIFCKIQGNSRIKLVAGTKPKSHLIRMESNGQISIVRGFTWRNSHDSGSDRRLCPATLYLILQNERYVHLNKLGYLVYRRPAPFLRSEIVIDRGGCHGRFYILSISTSYSRKRN